MIQNSFFTVPELHAQEKKALKFFNKMQREAMIVSANNSYYVCARGVGKSEGLDARFILQNVWSMPGSTGAMISPSYTKAWANTLPAICKALSNWGYMQNVHYYVGRKAPESAHFKQPKRAPLREAWGNCIHFWNGTVLVILSFSQGMSANSMSLDWMIGPEAKFLDYEKIKSEVNPANRGNINDFGYSPWHHSVMYTTDMPTSKMGRWILDKEKEMSNDHIQLIKQLYRELKQTERLPEQTEYIQKKVKELRRDLDIARKYQPPVNPTLSKKREYTVHYGEYDIFDNLEVIGEDYIWQMQRDEPTLIFRTAFLNERLFKVANCFYSALDEDTHFYIPTDNHVEYAISEKYSKTCLKDTDLDFSAPLHVAFDSNAAISTIVVGQVDCFSRELQTVNSLFVKTPKKLQDLVQKVCDYYEPKIGKQVVFYYDHTFTWTTGKDPESYADVIIRYFEKNGWEVTPVYIGQQPKHEWRHQQIDLAFKGDKGLLFPLFNLYNNEFLKIAMEQAGVRIGKNGFEKDKTPESTPDTPNNPDEYKTHITDAWDTLFVGVNFHYSEPSGYSGGVIFLG
jgi:hypothetical protein